MPESFVVQSRWDVNIDPATRNMLKFAAELRKTDALLTSVEKKFTGFAGGALAATHASTVFSTTTGAGMAATATAVTRLTTRLGRLQAAASGLHAPTSFVNQTATGLNNVSNSAAHAITMLGRLQAAARGARGHGRGWGSPASSFHNAMASFQEARMMFTPLTAPLNEASKYQNQMLAAKTSAFAQGGDSYRQYQLAEPGFRDIIRGAQRDTMFSTAEISGFLGSSIAGGITPDQIKDILGPMVKFADVQLHNKGTKGETSVHELIGLAHSAGKMTGADMARYTNMLTAATASAPVDIKSLGNILRYSQAQLKGQTGMDDATTIALATFAARMGMDGTRGGTATVAELIRSLPKTLQTASGVRRGKGPAGHEVALAKLGLYDHGTSTIMSASGALDPVALIDKLEAAKARLFKQKGARQGQLEFGQLVSAALLTNGSRLAMASMSNPAAREMLKQLIERLHGTNAELNAEIQRLITEEGYHQQLLQAHANFDSALQELGETLLPGATRWLKAFNDNLYDLRNWMQENPGRVDLLTKSLGGLGVALAVGATVNALAYAFAGLIAPMRAALALLNLIPAVAAAGAGGPLLAAGLAVGASAYMQGAAAKDRTQRIAALTEAYGPSAADPYTVYGAGPGEGGVGAMPSDQEVAEAMAYSARRRAVGMMRTGVVPFMGGGRFGAGRGNNSVLTGTGGAYVTPLGLPDPYTSPVDLIGRPIPNASHSSFLGMGPYRSSGAYGMDPGVVTRAEDAQDRARSNALIEQSNQILENANKQLLRKMDELIGAVSQGLTVDGKKLSAAIAPSVSRALQTPQSSTPTNDGRAHRPLPDGASGTA